MQRVVLGRERLLLGYYGNNSKCQVKYSEFHHFAIVTYENVLMFRNYVEENGPDVCKSVNSYHTHRVLKQTWQNIRNR